MEKNRIDYLDVSKGIGMICVILGHLSIGWINTIVFTFHMPLFFIIGGFFIKKSSDSTMVIKKVRQLIVPYIFTCLIIVVLAFVKDMIMGEYGSVIQDILSWLYAAIYGSGNNYTTPFYIKSIGAIWFLLAMFFAQVMYNFLLDKKYCIVAILLCVIFGFITVRYVYLPWSIQSGMFALVFVHTGHVMRQKKILENQNLKTLFVSLVIWLFCMYLDKGRFYLVGNYSKNLVIDILGGISGSYFVIGCSRKVLEITWIGYALKMFGKYSLIILCLHLIEVIFFPWVRFWSMFQLSNNNVIVIFTIIGKLVWCSLGALFILKIPVFKNIFVVSKKEVRESESINNL